MIIWGLCNRKVRNSKKILILLYMLIIFFFTEINANLILTQFLIFFEFHTFLLQRPHMQITFVLRISVCLSDMLEANAITCTYKSANCKMPCPSCIVQVEDLNNMNILKENIILRTPRLMASVIQNGEAKNYSIHNQKNVFWDFL